MMLTAPIENVQKKRDGYVKWGLRYPIERVDWVHVHTIALRRV